MFYTRLFSVIWTSPETGHYLSYQTKTQAQARADLYLSTPYVPTCRLLLFGYTSSKLQDVKKVDCVWNVMAHAQKPDLVFRRNGRVHLNRRGRQFSRLLAAEVCASAVVMLDTPCSEVAWEYWLPTPFASFPFTSPPVRHRVPSHLIWTLLPAFADVSDEDASWIFSVLQRTFRKLLLCEPLLWFRLGRVHGVHGVHGPHFMSDIGSRTTSCNDS